MPLLLVCHSIVIPSFLTHSSNSSIIQVIILSFYQCDFIVILSFLTHSSHSIVIPSFLTQPQSFQCHSVIPSSFCHYIIIPMSFQYHDLFWHRGYTTTPDPPWCHAKICIPSFQSFQYHSVIPRSFNISSFRCHSSIMIYFGTTGTTTQTPLVPCQNMYSIIPDSFQSFG